MARTAKLKAGDWVEVRSSEEIMKTLDEGGRLDGMPFMPEMLAFCGQRFKVYKRAHKTCDTVFPTRGRRVDRAVHLETRCNGSAHAGCQAGCLIFWKEDWLKRIDTSVAQPASSIPTIAGNGARLAAKGLDLYACTTQHAGSGELPKYVCQATQLPYATAQLEWWDIRQYIEDYLSGNVSLGRIIMGWCYSVFYHLSTAGIGMGRPLRWLYDQIHLRSKGTFYPRKRGTIPEGSPTPTAVLDLQPGEWVRVKSHAEILKTLNTSSMNRGMFWDAEMVPYCGGTYRVLRRVTQIINERTGELQVMKNPCVILDSVVCQARYSHCRMFCPRSIYPYWREIWLERVHTSSGG